jgi:hypothetical protein
VLKVLAQAGGIAAIHAEDNQGRHLEAQRRVGRLVVRRLPGVFYSIAPALQGLARERRCLIWAALGLQQLG